MGEVPITIITVGTIITMAMEAITKVQVISITMLRVMLETLNLTLTLPIQIWVLVMPPQ